MGVYFKPSRPFSLRKRRGGVAFVPREAPLSKRTAPRRPPPAHGTPRGQAISTGPSAGCRAASRASPPAFAGPTGPVVGRSPPDAARGLHRALPNAVLDVLDASPVGTPCRLIAGRRPDTEERRRPDVGRRIPMSDGAFRCRTTPPQIRTASHHGRTPPHHRRIALPRRTVPPHKRRVSQNSRTLPHLGRILRSNVGRRYRTVGRRHPNIGRRRSSIGQRHPSRG